MGISTAVMILSTTTSSAMKHFRTFSSRWENENVSYYGNRLENVLHAPAIALYWCIEIFHPSYRHLGTSTVVSVLISVLDTVSEVIRRKKNNGYTSFT